MEHARAAIGERVAGLGPVVNGWSSASAFGDRDFFGGDHMLRAAGAMAGWGGNDRIEADYPSGRVDADGEPLSGDRRYRLRLDEAPPAKAFWSITMYDTSYDGVAGYLVDNPIDRYLHQLHDQWPGARRRWIAESIHVHREEPDTRRAGHLAARAERADVPRAPDPLARGGGAGRFLDAAAHRASRRDGSGGAPGPLAVPG